jgi:hypothetical protein
MTAASSQTNSSTGTDTPVLSPIAKGPFSSDPKSFNQY